MLVTTTDPTYRGLKVSGGHEGGEGLVIVTTTDPTYRGLKARQSSASLRCTPVTTTDPTYRGLKVDRTFLTVHRNLPLQPLTRLIGD